MHEMVKKKLQVDWSDHQSDDCPNSPNDDE